MSRLGWEVVQLRGFRLRCLAASRKLGLPDNVARMLHVITLNKSKDGIDGAKAIIAAAKELEAKCGQRVRLIGIDTRIKAVAGDDENSNSDAAIYQAQRLAPIVASTGAAVISVAHPNREGDLRGASYIRQGDECVLYRTAERFTLRRSRTALLGRCSDIGLRLILTYAQLDGAQIPDDLLGEAP
jgi:AAA domain-containing protein